MKIKTEELTGAALDWAVAKCEGFMLDLRVVIDGEEQWTFHSYSTNWSQGGPIIEREWLNVTPWPNESEEEMRWCCENHDAGALCRQFGPTPLITAMRCYVASKLGDEIEIPEELV